MTLHPHELTRAECNRYIKAEHYAEPQPLPEPAPRTLWQQHPHVVIGLLYFAFWIGVALGMRWLGMA